ncbi:MAG TPA: hypothetical protein VHL11_18650 [Phototrophicaceae bacterium]|jgi:cytoskeletal protein RodZ|nr:hypothetical protein [Phototrophicaceae bacterium]
MQQAIPFKYTTSASYVPPYATTFYTILDTGDNRIINVMVALFAHMNGIGTCYPGRERLQDLSHYAGGSVDYALSYMFEKDWLRGHLQRDASRGLELHYQLSPQMMYISDANKEKALYSWETANIRSYIPPKEYREIWEKLSKANQKLPLESQSCWYGAKKGIVIKNVTFVPQPTTEPSLNNQQKKNNSLETTTTTDSSKTVKQAKAQQQPPPVPTPKKTKIQTITASITPQSEITSTVPKQAEIATTAAKPPSGSLQIQVPPASSAGSPSPSPAETGAEAMKRQALAAVEPAPTPSAAVSEPNDLNAGVTEVEIDKLAEQIADELKAVSGKMKEYILQYGYHQVKPTFEYVVEAHERKPLDRPAGLMISMLRKGEIPTPPKPKSLAGKYADFVDR